MTKTIAVLPALARPLLEPHLPAWLDARWFASRAEAMTMAPEAEIGWFDFHDKADMANCILAASRLKWLVSIYAGLDGMPLAELKARGTEVTNGAGINAVTIAEYVVMGMLIMAKGYRDVARAQDRHEWLHDSPGKDELEGSRALILGYGAIGKLVDTRLQAFGVRTTIVRRSGGDNVLGPDAWRTKLGDFDWIILAVPATPETDGMIGVAELAAMKPTARLVNVARGSVVDQESLIAALQAKTIGGAFLDVTSPEPLPADHALWALENAHITMHLSGRAQNRMLQRCGQRFLDNLARYHAGERLEPLANLDLGY